MIFYSLLHRQDHVKGLTSGLSHFENLQDITLLLRITKSCTSPTRLLFSLSRPNAERDKKWCGRNMLESTRKWDTIFTTIILISFKTINQYSVQNIILKSKPQIFVPRLNNSNCKKKSREKFWGYIFPIVFRPIPEKFCSKCNRKIPKYRNHNLVWAILIA